MAPENVNEANPISGRKSLFLIGFWGLHFGVRSGIHEMWDFSRFGFGVLSLPFSNVQKPRTPKDDPRHIQNNRCEVHLNRVGTNDASLLTQEAPR